MNETVYWNDLHDGHFDVSVTVVKGEGCELDADAKIRAAVHHRHEATGHRYVEHWRSTTEVRTQMTITRTWRVRRVAHLRNLTAMAMAVEET